MSLRELQRAFRADIAMPDDGAVTASPGMTIYRDAYRGRLLGALEISFERTRQWVGADAFTAAACHHILTSPPRSWTLDVYGEGFPELLASLFAGDPEVGELAWLEWQLQQAFAAPDQPALDPAALAAAGDGPEFWDQLRFTMAPGFAARSIATNCMALWEALGDGLPPPAVEPVAGGLLVWRQGLTPHRRLTGTDELARLSQLAAGASLGEIAADADPAALGTMLAQWFADGVFSAALPPDDS